MAKRGLRFKVFKSDKGHATHPFHFYFHAIAGNNEIVFPSEGYPDERTAHKALAGLWKSLCLATGAVKRSLFPGVTIPSELPPIPYTKDSLRPKEKTKG